MSAPGKELVGPLQRVQFGWMPRQQAPVLYVAPLPRDTRDPRWKACTDHRTACDCREAEHAESAAEYRVETREMQRQLVAAVQHVLAGHRLYDHGGPNAGRLHPDPVMRARYWHGDGPAACQCTGCRLVRANPAHPYIETDEHEIVKTAEQVQADREQFRAEQLQRDLEVRAAHRRRTEQLDAASRAAVAAGRDEHDFRLPEDDPLPEYRGWGSPACDPWADAVPF